MNQSVELDSDSESLATQLLLPTIEIAAVSMLYGAYTVLFGIAVWILPRKFQVKSVKKFLYPAIIALFILATVNVVYDLGVVGFNIVEGLPSSAEPAWLVAGQAIDAITFFLSDILGDTLLFFRVCKVWGSRKIVIIPLFLVMVPSKLLNIVSTAVLIWEPTVSTDEIDSSLFGRVDFFSLFAIANAISNSLLTLLLATRVWWLSRQVKLENERGGSSGQRFSRLYWRLLAIIVESGMIYPGYLIAAAIVTKLGNVSTLGAITVGLAPTIIAVRVGLGSAFEPRTESLPLYFGGNSFALSASDSCSYELSSEAGRSDFSVGYGNDKNQETVKPF